jgi:hypothetical protein
VNLLCSLFHSGSHEIIDCFLEIFPELDSFLDIPDELLLNRTLFCIVMDVRTSPRVFFFEQLHLDRLLLLTDQWRLTTNSDFRCVIDS